VIEISKAHTFGGSEMATGKITKSVVDRLEADGKWLWDTSLQGFAVRRQKDGAYYAVRYRINGDKRIKSLGRHGHLTPDTARAQALAALGKAAVGVDPFPEAPPAAESFSAEVERYLAQRKLKLKARSFVEVERHLRKDAKPLATEKLNEIDRRKIAVLLGGIETANGPFARNQVRASLSAFFTWAVKEGLLETNPVTATAKAESSGPRDRVLSQEELATIWRALGEDRFSDICRLLILTAQRRNEMGGLRLSEINFDRDLIVLPPARTKNKREHVEAILSHVSGHKAGVAGIYNRARYENEMREALERWANHVDAITSPTPKAHALAL
jgi:hypothetical protein